MIAYPPFFVHCGGGVGRLMANAIKNFHFDYLTPSLIQCNDFNYLTNVETNDDSQTAKNIHEGIIKDAKTFNGLEKLMNFEDLDFKSTVLK